MSMIIRITIELAKLKPIRCKNKTCRAPTIGFAHNDTMYISDSRGPSRVSITGNVITANGTRRSNARAIRFLAAQRQDRAVWLSTDEGVSDANVDSSLLFEVGQIRASVGYMKSTSGKGITLECEGCERRRTIRGMKYLISTNFIQYLIDTGRFNL